MLCVIRKGNLGGDSVLSTTKNGKSVLKFSVAEQVGFGEYKSTSWWRCNLWGTRAVALQQYLKKGLTVTVTGEATMSSYTDKGGIKKDSIDILVDQIEFFSGTRTPGEKETQGIPHDGSSESSPFEGFDQTMRF